MIKEESSTPLLSRFASSSTSRGNTPNIKQRTADWKWKHVNNRKSTDFSKSARLNPTLVKSKSQNELRGEKK